jgi:hypothetical protein
MPFLCKIFRQADSRNIRGKIFNHETHSLTKKRMLPVSHFQLNVVARKGLFYTKKRQSKDAIANQTLEVAENAMSLAELGSD